MKRSLEPKLHPLLIRAVAAALQGIFVEDRHADKVIEHALKSNPKAGSSDRAFIAETTYEVVRYYRLYCVLGGITPLREDDFWKLIGIHFILRHGADLPAWREFAGLHPGSIRERYASILENRPVRESIPDWLDLLGSEELGPLWAPTLSALNRPARVVLRTNTLKGNRATLQEKLGAEGILTVAEGHAEALVLEQRRNVFQTRAFREGLFEVQDYSSQQVARLLDPQPGMCVIDACAGGGGKTLHLSALMEGRGSLIALDTLSWKLEALRIRARRAGAHNIETRVIETTKTVKRLEGRADCLLLDVPCSGLGVLRRNPDSKWKIKPDFLAQIQQTQQEILQQYSKMLKPGGRMVYATCSVLPSENDLQVAAFLNSKAGEAFKLIQSLTIFPQDAGFDGFYLALMTNKD